MEEINKNSKVRVCYLIVICIFDESCFTYEAISIQEREVLTLIFSVIWSAYDLYESSNSVFLVIA